MFVERPKIRGALIKKIHPRVRLRGIEGVHRTREADNKLGAGYTRSEGRDRLNLLHIGVVRLPRTPDRYQRRIHR